MALYITLQVYVLPNELSILSFVLKIRYLTEHPQVLRFVCVLGDLSLGALASFVCLLAARHIGESISFRPFLTAFVLILAVVALLQPSLARAGAMWLTEVLKILLIVLALRFVSKLSWQDALSVWTFAYILLVIPKFFVDVSQVKKSSESSSQSSFFENLWHFEASVAKQKGDPTSNQPDVRNMRLLAEKGDAQAQYDLGLEFLANKPANGAHHEEASRQAFLWLTKSSEHNHAEAQLALGNMYFEGNGMPINPTEAARLYTLAAKAGNADAKAMMGWLHAHGRGVNWNAQKALQFYREAIEGGSPLGYGGLADLYLTGNGVPPDEQEGRMLYTKAAEAGSAAAKTKLGILTLISAQNAPPSGRATQYLYEAAKGNIPEAQYLFMWLKAEGIDGAPAPHTVRWWGQALQRGAQTGRAASQWYWALVQEKGLMGPSDVQEAWTWIAESAIKGYPDALHSKGDYLSYALAGKRDPAAALQAYQISAQVNPSAMQTLIHWYQNGIEVPRDLQKSQHYLAFLRLSASRGDPRASYCLGDLYRNGIVLPKSDTQALRLFEHAARNGVGQAHYQLAHMYAKGEGVNKDDKLAYRHYRKAADLFFAPSFFYIATRLAYGQGTAKDTEQAKTWIARIQRGAQRGDPAHQLNLARLAQQGFVGMRDEAQVFKLYQAAALRHLIEAERALAEMYRSGRGTPKNLIVAYCWFERATRSGDREAKRMRDVVWKEMTVAERTQAKRRSLNFSPMLEPK